MRCSIAGSGEISPPVLLQFRSSMPCSLPHIGLITIFGSRLCEIVDDGCQIVKESPISSNKQMRKPSPLWVAAIIVAITAAAGVGLVFWVGGSDREGLVV